MKVEETERVSFGRENASTISLSEMICRREVRTPDLEKRRAF